VGLGYFDGELLYLRGCELWRGGLAV